MPPGSASATSAVDATAMRRAAAAVRGATPLDEPRQPRRGDGQHHRVGVPALPLVVDQLPAPRRAVDPLDGHLRPPDAGPADELVDQHRVSAVDGAEDRPGHRRRQRLTHRVGQAARAPVQRGRQRRSGRPHADRGRRPGVHAGQQRIHRAGHHLLAEPVADQFGHRRVGAGPPGERPGAFVEHARDRGVVDQPGQCVRLRRDALQGVGAATGAAVPRL